MSCNDCEVRARDCKEGQSAACAPGHSRLAPRCVRSSTCACRSASASFLARPLGSSRSTGSKPQKRWKLLLKATAHKGSHLNSASIAAEQRLCASLPRHVTERRGMPLGCTITALDQALGQTIAHKSSLGLTSTIYASYKRQCCLCLGPLIKVAHMELLLAQRLLDLSTSARTRIKQVLLTRLSHKNNKACGLVRQEAADCL